MIQSKLIESKLLANYITQTRFHCNCIGNIVEVFFIQQVSVQKLSAN
jgi:hypothetical protein